MSQKTSAALTAAKSDSDRRQLCIRWLADTKIEQLTQHLTSGVAMPIIEQFTYLNCDFAFRQKFTEKRMVCFIEIMHYLMKMLIEERLSEEKSYEAFKELLLRHAIQRPPHSLAIFNLSDVKKIDLFVQDTYFRHYSMYEYTLTVKDQLRLVTKTVFEPNEPAAIDLLNQAVEVPAREIDEIYQYLSRNEQAEFERQKDYMLNGPGRIEKILNDEMEKLYSIMNQKIAKQDEEFLAKVPEKGGKK